MVDLDECVRRLLRIMDTVGLFDPPRERTAREPQYPRTLRPRPHHRRGKSRPAEKYRPHPPHRPLPRQDDLPDREPGKLPIGFVPMGWELRRCATYLFHRGERTAGETSRESAIREESETGGFDTCRNWLDPTLLQRYGRSRPAFPRAPTEIDSIDSADRPAKPTHGSRALRRQRVSDGPLARPDYGAPGRLATSPRRRARHR